MPYPFEDENAWLRRLPGYRYLYGDDEDQSSVGPGLQYAQPQDQGIGYYAAKLGEAALHGLGTAVSTAFYPLSLPKRGIDYLAREGVRLQGLTPQEDETAEHILGRALFPGQAEGAPEGETLTQQSLRGATELAAGFALDPLMYTGLPFSSATKGQNVAAKILADQPGLQLYAPKVASALSEAVEAPISRFAQALAERGAPAAAAGATAADRLSRASQIAEAASRYQKPLTTAAKAAHYGMIGQMAAGGVSGIAQAAAQASANGITPQVGYETVKALGELGMAGVGQFSHVMGEQKRARTTASQRQFEPTRVLPIDTLPDGLQQLGEHHARTFADQLMAGIDPSASELPEDLQPHFETILQQAKQDQLALNEGKSWIERLRREHQVGAEGVTVEDGPNENRRVIQRDKEGKIVGGAEFNPAGNNLSFIAGGRAVGENVSIGPVYAKLKELGVEKLQSLDLETGKPDETLSSPAAMARRRLAEKSYPRELLEGVPRKDMAKNLQKAQMELEQAGLGDIMAHPAYQISPDQARRIKMKTELPASPEFDAAVAGTPAAKMTPEGLLLDTTRFQQADQAGEPSIRTGVFYLPTGAAQAKYYRRAGTSYGGKYEVQGPTLLRRPLFVKGATGGKAPEAAYDQINGRGAYEAMRKEAISATNVFGQRDTQEARVADILKKFGADEGMAEEIVRHSKSGNQLPYAIQENIVAHAVRKAGYDSVLGWSKGKKGPYLSEVFDVRENAYPIQDEPGELHPDFAPAYAVRPGATEIGDTGFYSRLRELVDAPKTQGTQTGEQWLKFLSDPNRQVKQQELQETGLADWLKEKSGERVKREEVQQYLDQYGAKISVDARGGGSLAQAREELGGRMRLIAEMIGREEPGTERRLNLESRLDDLIRGAATKWGSSNYNLPGGVNYQERLLVTPPIPGRVDPNLMAKRKAVEDEYRPRIEELNVAARSENPLLHPAVSAEYGERKQRLAGLDVEMNAFRKEMQEKYQPGFTGEPNWTVDDQISGHRIPEKLRLLMNNSDYQRYANLKRSLQVSERKAIAHQVGIAKDLRDALETEMVAKLSDVGELPEAPIEYVKQAHWGNTTSVNAHTRLHEMWVPKDDGPSTSADGQRGERVLLLQELQSDRYNDLLDARKELADAEKAGFSPERAKKKIAELERSMPLAGQHTELLVKDALKYASDNGFDRVAWTTGDQQLERWKGLAAQVDRIMLDRAEPGKVRLRGVAGDGTTFDQVLSEKDLHQYVGRKNAETLMEQLAKNQEPVPPEPPKVRSEEEIRAEHNEKTAALNSRRAEMIAALKEEQAPAKQKRPREVGVRQVAINETGGRMEWRNVKGYEAGVPGWVITQTPDGYGVARGRYTVTHERSGMAALSDVPMRDAVAFAEDLKKIDVDWQELGAFGEGAWVRALPKEVKEKLAELSRKHRAGEHDRSRLLKNPLAVIDEELDREKRKALNEYNRAMRERDEALQEYEREKVLLSQATMKGEDLQVGGAGKRVYYDEILPRAMKTIGGKMGAGKLEDVELPQAGTVHSMSVPGEARERIKAEGFPLFAVAKKGEKKAPSADMLKFLVKLHPEGTNIRVVDGNYEVRLPNGKMVTWKPGVDHIEINVEAFEKGHERKLGAEEGAGVTYRLPGKAIVEIVEGADARVPLHEHWHVIKHLGVLSDKQLETLKSKFKNEEAEADAFADWWQQEQKPSDTIWQKIASGVNQLYEALTGSPAHVFRRAAKSALAVREATVGRKTTDLIPAEDQRVNLNWHLAASGQQEGRANAQYRKPPSEANTLRLERDGKPFFIGPLKNEEWLQKALAWVGPEGSKELGDARAWYRNLLGEFQKKYGKDAEKQLGLWTLTQQRASPSAGFANLLRAEDFVKGFRGPDEPKAGLAHDRLLAAIKNEPTPVGEKLSDFMDAVHGSKTRQWVAHDPRGGAPAPVDVHASRDVGFVDETSINKVRKFFGDEEASKLVEDLGGAPSDGQYFYGHERYNDLARWLNDQKVDGGNWTPDEVQAVGWVAQIRMMGEKAEGPTGIFPPSIAHVAIEAAPGEGSPRAERWAQIPEERRSVVTQRMIADIAPEAAKLAGVRVLSKMNTTGGWEQYLNPNVVFEVLGPEGARRFAKLMARALHQTEVWAQRVAPKSRANAVAVDISGTKDYDFSKPGDVPRFWNDTLAKESGLGFSVVTADGEPVVRVIVDNMKTAKAVSEKLPEGFVVKARPLEVFKSVNDWKVNDAGEVHTADLRGVRGQELDAFLGRSQESFERRVSEAISDEGEAYPSEAQELTGEALSAEPRGPPPAYATQPLGQPKPPGQQPRVEERVQSLDEAINEQRRLGIPAKDLNLAREQRRAWQSIDPEIKKKIMAWDDDEMFRVHKRRSFDDVEVQALDAVVRGRREAKELARIEYQAAKGGPDEAATWRKYVESLANFVPLERMNVNDGTGTARALAARGRIMQAALTRDNKFLRQVLREIPGIDDQAAQDLQAMFETGDPRLADALRAAFAGRWKQWQTILRAFLITPTSEIANGIGNTLGMGVEIADRAAASGVDWVASALRGTNRERHLGAVGAGMGTMLEAVPGAVKEFLNERFVQIYKRAMSGEAKPGSIEPGRRLEYQIGAPFYGKGVLARMGRFTATSLDAMQAGDELFQAPIAQQELGTRAYEMAKAKMPHATHQRLMAETVNIVADAVHFPEKYDKLLNDVRSSTQRRLFKDKPWHMVGVLQNLSERYPWMSAVLPFIKTPGNIARYAIHHSPMGMMTPEFGRAVMRLASKEAPKEGEMSKGEAADVVARRLVGTVIFGMAAGAAKLGRLTNGGPGDPDEKKALMETGWRPYSIVVDTPAGKGYIPFARFDPVSQVMGIAADTIGVVNARDANDAATRAVGSIAENFTNRTYLQGLIDFSEALSDPLRFAGNYAIGIGEMHIPRQVARIAQALDPVVRDVRPATGGIGGFLERAMNSVKRDIPGVSQSLPAKVGPTGEEVMRPGEGLTGALMRAGSPVQVSPERQGRNLEALMAQIGYVPPEPRRFMTIKGHQIVLNQKQLDTVHKADRAAAFDLRGLVANPMFAALPDTIEEGGERSKEGIIRKVYNKHRDLARQAIMMQPDFISTAREQLASLRGVGP